MIHLANILIAATPALGQTLLRDIRGHGYEGRAVTSQEAALASARQEQPDVILVGPLESGEDSIGLVAALKGTAGCATIPICLVTDERSVALKRRAVAAGANDLLVTPIETAKLIARLRPLVRLATMRGEMHQRVQTAARFNIVVNETLPPIADESTYSLLIVGKAPDSLAASLPRAKLTFAADPFLADELLGRSNFDAAILAPQADAEPYLDLCAKIRNNPRLFNLPVLMVDSGASVSERVAYHHGASDFFEQPFDPADLEIAVLLLVRRQRQRWSIRQVLQKTLQPESRDTATGIYDAKFLGAYLTDQVSYAQIHGRHLSVIFFRVPDVEGVRQHFGDEQAVHLRLQLAQWITSLLRVEDMTARSADNEFCVVLPDTPIHEAEIVMNRIAGVLAYTDFAVKDVYQPVKVWVRVGATDFRPEDDVDSLINRARSDIV